MSSWVAQNENSVLEELPCEDNFENRKIGEKKKNLGKRRSVLRVILVLIQNQLPSNAMDVILSHTEKLLVLMKEVTRNIFIVKFAPPQNEGKAS